MEDRELLELAAKATRLGALNDIDWRQNGDGTWTHFLDCEGRQWETWNPLANDGDAFRLSVDLQISLLSNIIRYEASTISLTLAGIFIKEDMLNQSPDVAARRAIVRAAAELGRMMP